MNETDIIAALIDALKAIRDQQPKPYELPADLQEQIDNCKECQEYRNHPIQQGICNTHRQPLWAREKHYRHEEAALGVRAADIARNAIAKAEGKS